MREVIALLFPLILFSAHFAHPALLLLLVFSVALSAIIDMLAFNSSKGWCVLSVVQLFLTSFRFLNAGEEACEKNFLQF